MVGETGKRQIVFKRPRDVPGDSFPLPCGQCVGCRLERSRQWAMRCMHEASLYRRNCFLTLTMNDSVLAEYECLKCGDGASLCVCQFQRFMKRFRKRFSDDRIRFFHCGEYGEKGGRPHYHAAIFNFDFSDRVFHKVSKSGFPIFVSQTLDELWGLGFAWIGDVSFESAAYVARYIMKKVNGDAAEEHYAGRRPEYVTMSRRPGIGRGWFDKFKTDVFPSDGVVVRGREMRPPRFYDGLYELDNPEEFGSIKRKRIAAAMAGPSDERSMSRLSVMEKVKRVQVSRLSRTLDGEL